MRTTSMKVAGSIAAAVVIAACTNGEAAVRREVAGTAPIPVVVVPVSMTGSTSAIEAVGTLGAKEEVPLAFKIGGIVSRVAAEEGQSVRAGALLAELAPAEIGAEVEKARQVHAKAERDLARARSLYADSVATLEQLQDATTAFEVAASNLRIAEFNQQHASVRAPNDGIVLKRSVEPGQLVGPGVPVFTLRTDRRGLVLRAGVPDRDAVRLRAGDPAEVQFDAFPGVTLCGRVTQIAAAATSGTGTYAVEVAVDAQGRALASGLVGHVAILPRDGTRVPTVPVQALVEANGDSATVFTLSADGSVALRRRVRIGPPDGARVAVLGGAEGVQHVVTAGAEWLTDSAKVVRKLPPVAARRVP